MHSSDTPSGTTSSDDAHGDDAAANAAVARAAQGHPAWGGTISDAPRAVPESIAAAGAPVEPAADGQRAEEAKARPQTIVASVHGIRTRGKWQKELVPVLSQAGFTPVPLDYGNFWALELLIPQFRRRKVEWFFR